MNPPPRELSCEKNGSKGGGVLDFRKSHYHDVLWDPIGLRKSPFLWAIMPFADVH